MNNSVLLSKPSHRFKKKASLTKARKSSSLNQTDSRPSHSVSVRIGSGDGSSWLIHLVCTGVSLEGFNPQRKQWTASLRQVPRSVSMGLVRTRQDDTRGNKGLRRRPMVALSSVFWMDPQSWLLRAFVSRISASRTVPIGSFRAR